MSFFPFLKTLRVEEINYSNDHPFTSTPIFFPCKYCQVKYYNSYYYLSQLLDGFYVMLQFVKAQYFYIV